uniref:Craniofacial development protein 2-like n=1 Tax=Nicotiana sylvestris TaxID=4096 RepID=A0A1U7Y9M7_NICSY|nr:PREDICTED: craniofacial development protein 2-like [Nicotiana sylvestris]
MDWVLEYRDRHGKLTGLNSGIQEVLGARTEQTPQAGFDEEVKRHFWENLNEVVRGVPLTEKLFIGGDFNGHIGESARGCDYVHSGFGFRGRKEAGISLLEFSKVFDLVIANTCFQKREDHLVTFWSTVAKTHIDYLFCRKYDRGMCTDCKVIPSECLSTQHRLLIMVLEIKRKRKKRTAYGQPKIKWGALTKDKAHELGRS